MLLVCQILSICKYEVLFGLFYQKNGHLQMSPKFRELWYIMIYFTMSFFCDHRSKIITWCNVIQQIKKVLPNQNAKTMS